MRTDHGKLLRTVNRLNLSATVIRASKQFVLKDFSKKRSSTSGKIFNIAEINFEEAVFKHIHSLPSCKLKKMYKTPDLNFIL